MFENDLDQAVPSSLFVIDPVASQRKEIRSSAVSAGVRTEFFNSAAEFRRLWIGPKPGCVLLNLGSSAPTIASNLELQAFLAKEHEYLCIIASGAVTNETIFECSQLGAVAFVEDLRTTDTVIVQVQAALQEASLRWEIWQRKRAYRERLSSLTRRELEVYALLIDGLNNREMASCLSIAVGTIEKHKSAVLHKVQAKNPAHLLSQAFAAMGTLRIDEPSHPAKAPRPSRKAIETPATIREQ